MTPVEDRLELAQGLEALLGAGPEILGQGLSIARRDVNRADLLRQPSLAGAGRRPLVRDEGELVLRLAGDAELAFWGSDP
jgi:hypothetical protein